MTKTTQRRLQIFETVFTILSSFDLL